MSLAKRIKLRFFGHQKTLEQIISKETNAFDLQEVIKAYRFCGIECKRTSNNGIKFSYNGRYIHEIKVTPDPDKKIDNLSFINEIYKILNEIYEFVKTAAGAKIKGEITDVSQFLDAIEF